ncbi:hypothetical protein [Shinella pollutisoli]|uniref:Uncharacterized protein n=1 Tax=Shinella pollutisoli TaxID=2250594 RepID=A0ABV7DKM1_9HYPH|nr:hypothetical protein [Shinella pollutisoli]
MLSRGALNGSEINAFDLDGGRVVQDLAAGAVSSVAADLRIIRRQRASGIGTPVISASLHLRGMRLRGWSVAVAFGMASARRRVGAEGFDAVGTGAMARAIRRHRVRVSGEAAAAAMLRLSVSFTAPTEFRRVMRLRQPMSMRAAPQASALVVGAEPRTMVVPAAEGLA